MLLALRRWIRETREMTDKPFGLNLVPSFRGPDVFEAQFQVILQEKPRMLSLFYAEDYVDMIPRAKDAGLVVMVRVGSAKLARQALAQGADIITAQRSEGGPPQPGHCRTYVVAAFDRRNCDRPPRLWHFETCPDVGRLVAIGGKAEVTWAAISVPIDPHRSCAANHIPSQQRPASVTGNRPPCVWRGDPVSIRFALNQIQTPSINIPI